MKSIVILFFISFGFASNDYWQKFCSLTCESPEYVKHVCLQFGVISEKNCSSQFDKSKVPQCQCSEENIIDKFFNLEVLNKFPSLISIDISYLDIDVLNFKKCINQMDGVEKIENCQKSNIKMLNVSHNKFKEFDEVIFDIMPNISGIDLSFNSIKILTRAQFYRANYLEYLDVSSNQIENINIDTFQNNSKLKILNLKNNSLKQFDFKIFSPKAKLIDVYLQSDIIKKLDISCSESSCHFQHFSKVDFFKRLKNFRASGIKHQNVSNLCQQIGEDLKTLDLSFNALIQINKEFLERFTNLQHLNMSHSNISDIACNAFINQSKLISLDLSYNNLTSTAFLLKFSFLQTLNLEGNQLLTINRIVPSNFKSLASLAISMNCLSCIYLRQYFKNWPNLTIVSKISRGEINIRGVYCVVEASETFMKKNTNNKNVIFGIDTNGNTDENSTWLFIAISAGLVITLIAIPAIIWFCCEKFTLSKYKASNYANKPIRKEDPNENVNTVNFCLTDENSFEDIPLNSNIYDVPILKPLNEGYHHC